MGSLSISPIGGQVLESSVLPYVLSEKVGFDDTWKTSALSTPDLPDGFPAAVHHLQTWTATDVDNFEEQWMLQLSTEEACAIEHAVKAFLGWFS